MAGSDRGRFPPPKSEASEGSTYSAYSAHGGSSFVQRLLQKKRLKPPPVPRNATPTAAPARRKIDRRPNAPTPPYVPHSPNSTLSSVDFSLSPSPGGSPVPPPHMPVKEGSGSQLAGENSFGQPRPYISNLDLSVLKQQQAGGAKTTAASTTYVTSYVSKQTSLTKQRSATSTSTHGMVTRSATRRRVNNAVSVVKQYMQQKSASAYTKTVRKMSSALKSASGGGKAASRTFPSATTASTLSSSSSYSGVSTSHISSAGSRPLTRSQAQARRQAERAERDSARSSLEKVPERAPLRREASAPVAGAGHAGRPTLKFTAEAARRLSGERKPPALAKQTSEMSLASSTASSARSASGGPPRLASAERAERRRIRKPPQQQAQVAVDKVTGLPLWKARMYGLVTNENLSIAMKGKEQFSSQFSSSASRGTMGDRPCRFSRSPSPAGGDPADASPGRRRSARARSSSPDASLSLLAHLKRRPTTAVSPGSAASGSPVARSPSPSARASSPTILRPGATAPAPAVAYLHAAHHAAAAARAYLHAASSSTRSASAIDNPVFAAEEARSPDPPAAASTAAAFASPVLLPSAPSSNASTPPSAFMLRLDNPTFEETATPELAAATETAAAATPAVVASVPSGGGIGSSSVMLGGILALGTLAMGAHFYGNPEAAAGAGAALADHWQQLQLKAAAANLLLEWQQLQERLVKGGASTLAAAASYDPSEFLARQLMAVYELSKAAEARLSQQDYQAGFQAIQGMVQNATDALATGLQGATSSEAYTTSLAAVRSGAAEAAALLSAYSALAGNVASEMEAYLRASQFYGQVPTEQFNTMLMVAGGALTAALGCAACCLRMRGAQPVTATVAAASSAPAAAWAASPSPGRPERQAFGVEELAGASNLDYNEDNDARLAHAEVEAYEATHLGAANSEWEAEVETEEQYMEEEVVVSPVAAPQPRVYTPNKRLPFMEPIKEEDSNKSVLSARGAAGHKVAGVTGQVFVKPGQQWGTIVQKASSLYRLDLRLRSKSLLFADVKHEIASTLLALDRALASVKARPWEEEGIRIFEFDWAGAREHLGTAHPAVGWAFHNFGLILMHCECFPEADLLFKRAVGIFKRTFKPDAEEVADSLDGLRQLATKQGRLDQAHAYNARVLHMREKALGRAHPRVADTLYLHANLDCALGRYTAAASNYLAAIQLWEEQGESTKRLADALGKLGSLHNYMGQYQDAEACQHRALAMNEELYGLYHPEVVVSHYSLAAAKCHQGKYEECMIVYHNGLLVEQSLEFSTTHVTDSRQDLMTLLREHEMIN